MLQKFLWGFYSINFFYNFNNSSNVTSYWIFSHVSKQNPKIILTEKFIGISEKITWALGELRNFTLLVACDLARRKKKGVRRKFSFLRKETVMLIFLGMRLFCTYRSLLWYWTTCTCFWSKWKRRVFRSKSSQAK